MAFSGFYYTLREKGIPVSLNEWLTLMKALSLGLAGNSLTEFYLLARSLLVKSETFFDQYDIVFLQYFGEGTGEQAKTGKTPVVERAYNPDFFNPARYRKTTEKTRPETDAGEAMETAETRSGDTEWQSGGRPEEEFGRPAKTQSGEHAGNVRHTGGASGGRPGNEFETSGSSFSEVPGGMTALRIAGGRKYREYKDDSIKNIRQYEIALRALRQLSSRVEGPKDELNLEATVEETGRGNGKLSLVWERPRKNAIKLILLMDSIGSITSHHSVCQKVFNAAHRSTSFKEIRYYYFHNCVYGRVYKNQWLDVRESVAAEDFFRMYNADYRLLLVGDARMSQAELMQEGGILEWSAERNKESGQTWLRRFAGHFPYAVWLNPVPQPMWGLEPGYASITDVGKIFPMYELTPAGITKAVKRLRVRSG